MTSLIGKSWFWQLALAVLLLTIYVCTLLPGPGDHPDTAKFQFVGYILGTPHAPGYPTYIVISHVFGKYFPFGSLAYRINLLSAIFSVVACLFLFRILRLLETGNVSAFIASLAFGFTRTLWSQSIIAEVYALNIMFVSLVIYYFLRWNLHKEDRFILIACAIYSLSFGNHLTMVTFLPAVLFLVITTDKGVFIRPRLVFSVLQFIAIGMLQYYYPLWRYHDRSTLYLDMQTPDLQKLIYAVTGGHFKPLMFTFSAWQTLTERLPMFLKLLWNEYSFLMPLIAYGVLRTRNRVVGIFLLLCILGNLFFALNYNIPDIYVYFIPTYFVLAIFLGIGVERMFSRLAPSLHALFLFLPLLLLLMNFAAVDQHNNTAGQQAKDILNLAGEDAVVFGRGRQLPKMYFFYYLFGEDYYRNHNLYVVKFTPRFVDAYLFHKHAYRIREMRRQLPQGLKIYCTTEAQKNSLQEMGFHITRVGEGVYRAEGKALTRPTRMPALEQDEED